MCDANFLSQHVVSVVLETYLKANMQTKFVRKKALDKRKRKKPTLAITKEIVI